MVVGRALVSLVVMAGTGIRSLAQRADLVVVRGVAGEAARIVSSVVESSDYVLGA